MSKPSTWLPSFLALGVVWGASFLFIEWALESLTPIGVAFMRGALGAVSLLIMVAVKKVALPSRLIEWMHLGVVATLLNAVPGFLFALGQEHVTSVMAGILNATTPLMTLLVIVLLFREEKTTTNQIVGLLLGFLGVALVSGIGSGLGENDLFGVIALLSATLCYGFSFPYARRFILTLPYDNTALAAGQVLSSAVILLPFALIFGIQSAPWNAESVTGIVLLGLLGTGYAYVWNYRNMKLAGSAIASSVTYITPVVAAVLGVTILGETLRWDQIVGGVIVMVAAAMVQQRLVIIGRK
ncbi:MAG: DMT family transporter [Microbacteriaceae bacterium]